MLDFNRSFKVKSFTIYIYYDILLPLSFVVDDIDSETDRLEVNHLR